MYVNIIVASFSIILKLFTDFNGQLGLQVFSASTLGFPVPSQPFKLATFILVPFTVILFKSRKVADLPSQIMTQIAE